MAATLKALDMQIEGTSIRLPSHADIVDGLGTFVDGKINTFSSTKVVPALNGLSDLYLGKNATAAKATADANGVNIANNYLKASVAASTYLGKSAEASIATKARQDGDGNVISSTYLKSSAASTTYLAKADKYSHPTQTALTGAPTANQTPVFGGTFSVSQATVNTLGHVTALTSRTIKIPDTAATTLTAGLMSAADKIKLNGISAGAGGSTTLAAAAAKLATARNINGTPFDGTQTISFGGVCSTAANVAEKRISMQHADIFTLDAGVIVAVTFYYENTASNVTVNVGDTGALPLYRGTTQVSGAFTKNSYGVVLFKYCVGGHTGDNSQAYWQIVEPSLDVGRANAGTLSIARGGTGATTAALARASLGAAAADHTHAASDINSGVLPVARGGTGASTTALALTTLGAAAANHTHSGYAATSHTHAAGDIASGTLAVARGGTGQTSLDSVVVGKAKTLNTARYIDGVGFDGSANISHGAICSTAAATAAKVADFSDGGTFAKRSGTVVSVLFAYVNTAENITLNLGGTGALPVYRDNVKVSGAFTKNTYGVVHLKYCVGGHTGNNSNEYWQIIEPSLDVSRASAGTLPVARGGTGQTSLANVKVGSATAADSVAGLNHINGFSTNAGAGIYFWANCDTAAATAAKTATTASNFEFSSLTIIWVRFKYVNTADNPTLNINGTGAYPIFYGVNAAYGTRATRIVDFAYQSVALSWVASSMAGGTGWRIISPPTYTLTGAVTATAFAPTAAGLQITTAFNPSVALKTVEANLSDTTYAGDFNNYVNCGYFKINASSNLASWKNRPNGLTASNFVLEVLGNNSGLLLQRLNSPVGECFFVRYKANSVWKDWQKFTGTVVTTVSS